MSLFLNLAAYGERIRLNGTIEELTKAEMFTIEYINAQAENNNALRIFSQNQNETNVAILRGDDKKLAELIAVMPTLADRVEKTASATASIREKRLDFINSIKYANKVNLPRQSIE